MKSPSDPGGGPPLQLPAGAVPTGPVVVALSGGADSAAVAWLVTQRDDSGSIEAVFVDHGWVHSGRMRRAATAVASALGVPLTVIAVGGDEPGPGESETQARTARMVALEKHAAGRPVLTGHHAGDDAETVLGNLIRGSGSTGLSGIPPRRGPFHRPLLAVARNQVRSLVDSLGLPYVDDPANDDPGHRRNRLRHEVMPLLENVTPGATDAIVRSGGLIGADDALLEQRATAFAPTTAGGVVRVAYGALVALPPPVVSRVVRQALRLARPPYAGSTRDVEQVLAVRRGSTGQLGGGLLCQRDGGHVIIFDPAGLPPPPSPVSLRMGHPVDFGHWRVTADVEPAAGTEGDIRPDRVPAPGRAQADIFVPDGDVAPMWVRVPEPGERIDIGAGSRKVNDLLADAGVAVARRPGWPVVDVHGKIAWLVGVRVAAWAHRSDERVVPPDTVVTLSADPGP